MQTNPILKNIRNFSLYLLFWIILVLLYFLFLITGENIEITIAIADSLIFNFILCGLGLSFWYSAKYISFENNKISMIVLSHALGGFITSIIWLSLGYFIITSIYPSSSNYKDFFYSTLVWRFLIGFLFYFLITTFYYVIIYYTGFQERIIREAETQSFSILDVMRTSVLGQKGNQEFFVRWVLEKGSSDPVQKVKLIKEAVWDD